LAITTAVVVYVSGLPCYRHTLTQHEALETVSLRPLLITVRLG